MIFNCHSIHQKHKLGSSIKKRNFVFRKEENMTFSEWNYTSQNGLEPPPPPKRVRHGCFLGLQTVTNLTETL